MSTDVITFLLSFFFLLRGAARGLMNSLITPVSIIITTAISILYYQLTNDMIVSLGIGLIGPLLMNIILKFLLVSLVDANGKILQPSFLSRLGGSIVTFIWGWVFIILILLSLAILPPWGKTLTAVHNDVLQSFSYSIAKYYKENLFPSPKQNTDGTTTSDPNSAARSLALDPRFQNTMNDPEVQEEIQSHDAVRLVSNPKVMAMARQILIDPSTIKKVMAIYNNQPSAQTTQN